MFDLNQYLDQAFQGFAADRPDTDFQRGYLAAFVELAKAAGIEIPAALADVVRELYE
jgi:hypothetical protein